MSSYAVKLSREGRILIPADVRADLGLSEGSSLHLCVRDGEIRLYDRTQALRRAQQIVARYKQPDESLVDELLSERRAAVRTE